MTLGDIAGILVDKGEVEQALILHQERIQVFESLGDLSEKAQTLWGIAQIEIEKQDWQNAFSHLEESYQINLNLGRLDGIAWVGIDLGQLLCMADQVERGLAILNRSLEGFQKLQRADYVQQVQQLIAHISPPT